jgi:hypothetical protein
MKRRLLNSHGRFLRTNTHATFQAPSLIARTGTFRSWLKAEAIWQEKHRPKIKSKQSQPLKRTKSRKTSAVEKEL